MIAWLRLALLRLRDERLSAVGLAGLVLVTAFIAAATPRLLDRVADDTLRQTVVEATAVRRNIQLVEVDGLASAGSDPGAAVTTREESLFAQFPASVAALVRDRGWSAQSGRWRLPQVSGDPSTMRLRIEPGAMDHLRLVDGRWPTGATERVPDGTSKDSVPPQLTAFELALSTETATRLHLHLGDVLTLVPDATDPLVPRQANLNVAVRLVGTFEVADEADSWWLDDTTPARPAIRSPGGDATIVDAAGFLAPDAYKPYMLESLRGGFLVRYAYREYLDPARLEAASVDRLLVDVKRLETTFPPSTGSVGAGALGIQVGRPPQLIEGLRVLIEGYRSQWASAAAVLTIGGIGPAAVAVGALALVAGLAARRRRSTLALARGRGASLGQAVLAVVIEGLLVAAPAAAAAIGLVVLLIPAKPVIGGPLAAAAVAGLATLLLVVATVPATGGPAFGSGREVAAPRRPGLRRLLFEGLVVVMALAGAYLLRERGLRGLSSTGQLGPADPLIAAVPALIGIAAGLLAMRIFPFPMRLLAWLAHRGRGLVPALAMRRAADARRTGPGLVVLLVTAAIWAFSSSVLLYIDRAADAVAWHHTGAAYRIDSTTGQFPVTFDPAALPQAEAAAGVHRDLVNMGPRHLTVQLLAVAVEAYDKVTAGTPAALDLPLDFYATSFTALPVLVSQAVADRPDGVRPGDEFDASVEGHPYPMRVVGIIGELPGMATGVQYAVVSRDQMVQLVPDAYLRPSVVYLRAPIGAEGAIRAAVPVAVPVASSVVSQAAEATAIRTTPIARAVVAGMTAAAIIAFAYAVLAVAAGLALAGAGQAVEIAHLRTLGLSDRQAAGLVVVENGPVVLAGFGLGLGLGIGTFVFLREGLGLEALIGSRVDVPLVLDPGQLAIVLGGIVGVIVLGLVLGTLMQRGAAPSAAVRRGFE